MALIYFIKCHNGVIISQKRSFFAAVYFLTLSYQNKLKKVKQKI